MIDTQVTQLTLMHPDCLNDKHCYVYAGCLFIDCFYCRARSPAKLNNLEHRLERTRERAVKDTPSCPHLRDFCAYCTNLRSFQCAACGCSICQQCKHRWGSKAYGEELCRNCGHGLLWTPEPDEEWFYDDLFLV